MSDARNRELFRRALDGDLDADEALKRAMERAGESPYAPLVAVLKAYYHKRHAAEFPIWHGAEVPAWVRNGLALARAAHARLERQPWYVPLVSVQPMSTPVALQHYLDIVLARHRPGAPQAPAEPAPPDADAGRT